jgi:F0F1-type ATP synthase assembly protein I
LVPAGERPEQRKVWEGFSNALSYAVELAGVTAIFVLFGLWLDGRAGTKPLFTVVLGLFAVIGLAIRAYYTYMERIRREEEGKPWTRTQP